MKAEFDAAKVTASVDLNDFHGIVFKSLAAAYDGRLIDSGWGLDNNQSKGGFEILIDPEGKQQGI